MALSSFRRFASLTSVKDRPGVSLPQPVALPPRPPKAVEAESDDNDDDQSLWPTPSQALLDERKSMGTLWREELDDEVDDDFAALKASRQSVVMRGTRALADISTTQDGCVKQILTLAEPWLLKVQ